MREPFWGESRGTSVLGSLVMIAMLGGAALLADVGSPVSHQSPSAQVALLQAMSPTKTTAATQPQTEGILKDNHDPHPFIVAGTTYVAYYGCDQKAPIDKVKELQQNCQAGFTYTVRTNVSQVSSEKTASPSPTREVTVEATPTGMQCPTGAPDKQCANKQTAKKTCFVQGQAPKVCQVMRCNGDICTPVGFLDTGKDIGVQTASMQSLADALKSAKSPTDQQQILSSLDPNTRDALSKALEGAPSTDSSKNDPSSSANPQHDPFGPWCPTGQQWHVDKCVDSSSVPQQPSTQGSPKTLGACDIGQVWINGICYKHEGPASGPSGAGSCKLGQVWINNNCYTTIGPEKPLADVKAPPPNDPTKMPPTGQDVPLPRPNCQVNPSSNGCPCPAGFSGVQPTCTRSNQQTFNQPGPNNQQKTDGGPSFSNPGPFGPQSLGKQAPPPGNGFPQQPGSCSPGTICGSNVIYARNNQCVDQVMQQCPYGCTTQNQGSTGLLGFGSSPSSAQCNPPPQQGQQCPQAPRQPEPSGCQNGTWRPTYGSGSGTNSNNSCVTGWQCVPSGSSGGGSGQLRAEISCQPKVADVGMSVAISYSCSAGESEGSGFDTDGARSGSTSVTLTTPPGNTNTATFSLTCKDQGKTERAQCSVQIAKASIVLVANPEAVERGKTSRIGWITSGMKSCVISSPDSSEFTSQNASTLNVNGTTMTPPLTRSATYVLRCETLGGASKEQQVTVNVI